MIPSHRKLTGAAKKVTDSDGYRQVLRWVALPVTDRRWAAPLCAIALGFGLFAGVAIGPGAAGTLATGASQIIEVPGFSRGTSSGGDGGDEGGGPSATVASSAGASGDEGSSDSESSSALPSFAPASEGEFESEAPAAPEKSPSKTEAPPPTEEAEPEALTLSGMVVHVNPAAGSYTLAEPSGVLDAIHAAKPPRPGTRVSVPVRLLANGTFAEAGTQKKTGTAARAGFDGVVTYVDPTPTAPAYTVSKRGVSVLVHVRPDPAGAPPVLPALGAFASVDVDIEKPSPPASTSASAAAVPAAEPGATAPVETPPPAAAPASSEAPPAGAPTCGPDPTLPAFEPAAILWQRQISAEGAPFTFSDFAGIVEAVCPGSQQLLLSADDLRQGLHDLLFTVPPAIDTAKLEVGQSVLATATINADGSLALTGLASDERTKGADDAEAAFGDLAPAKAK